jgi:glycine betaine transporter
MLFAAGMGVGLLFWGAAEPLIHFAGPPVGEARTPEAAGNAITLTIFSWGLHAWAIYCFAGLALAYYGFHHHAPHLAGTPIRHAFSGPWVRPVAAVADLVAVVAVAVGVAASAGTGLMQFHAGLHFVTGLPLQSAWVPLALLALLFIAYMTSAATGLTRGIKWLSNINMVLAVLLMLFVLLAGPTAFLFRGFITGIGDYLVSLPRLSLQLFPYDDAATWLHTWPLTNLLWWIAWAPFVGAFIARISRGRTIRIFVLGVLFVPTTFSLLWFAVLGGTALHEELFGAGGLARLAQEDATQALFALFDRLPGATVLGWIAVFLIFIFLVTSLDSATFVLGMLTSGGSPEPSTMRRLAWGTVVGGLTAALLLSGNVHAVRAVAISAAIPFILILMLQAVALVVSLAHEREIPDSSSGLPHRLKS